MRINAFKQILCVLSFDEMKIQKQFLYDKLNDETLKPAAYAQVGMVRGLFGNWKQPIFYDFDCRITDKILFDIISQVEETGFHVIAKVCDLGGPNRGLLQQLNISCTKPWFLNPADPAKKMYVFADVPHLIKLIRNNFVDHGFIIDKKLIEKTIIEELLSKTNSTSELSIAHKISSINLTVRNAGRQKVRLATKLFHTLCHKQLYAVQVWAN